MYEKKNSLKIESNAYTILVRDIAILELFFSTGIRVSELSYLKSSSMDLNKSTMRITGKGDKERLIPICSVEAREALNCYFKIYRKRIEVAEYFFLNQSNKRLSEQSIRFMIKKYTKELKIDVNITPHMFRHSLATMLLENEVGISYIQELLGHTSISTTQIYLSINKKKQRSILTKKHPRKNLH